MSPTNESRKAQPTKILFAGIPVGLKSHLTWLDLLFGSGAAMLIAGLLLGFRLQALPEYKVGDIATQQVRAPQEVIYEDKEATAGRREAARDRTLALYELEVDRIVLIERQIHLAFETAREVLASQRIPAKGRLSGAQQKLTLGLLEKEVGKTLSPQCLPLLLEQRFAAPLEKKIVAILAPVLRDGIMADPDHFRLDLRKGIVLRDRGTLVEGPLVDASRVRTPEAAKEHLRRFQLEFSELSAPQLAELFAFLDTLLIPTLVYNSAETVSRREAAAARVTPVEVQIKKGKVLIRSGEEVTPRAKADLAALRNLLRPRPILGRLLSLFFLVALFLVGPWLYFAHNRRRYHKIRMPTVLLVLVIVLFGVMMRLFTALADILGEHLLLATPQAPFVIYFAIPFPFASMLLTLLIDMHVGFILSMIVGALAGLFYGDAYLAVYVLTGSLAAIYSLSQYRERYGLAKSGLRIGAVNALAAFAISFLRQDTFIWSEMLIPIIMGGLSGILAAALASILLPALEAWFKIATDIRLLELSNFNAPFLRRLAMEAPGTYHHSLMVGTLAEEAAEAIGANLLLARVAAYYHDLGKILKPEYFRENQGGGENRHDSLSPAESGSIVAGHVKDGLELAKRAGLMEPIRDMIPQHHGTRLMTYFYQKAREIAMANGLEVKEEDFRYPGPKPKSKEAAILMMADSVEAASRTLSNPSSPQIQGLIDRLIDDVLADNQLDECDITLREIRLVKEAFLRVLSGFHHRRIDYPGYDFTKVDNAPM